jgi:hypothetical protein
MNPSKIVMYSGKCVGTKRSWLRSAGRGWLGKVTKAVVETIKRASEKRLTGATCLVFMQKTVGAFLL